VKNFPCAERKLVINDLKKNSDECLPSNEETRYFARRDKDLLCY
jgi:hypothetical protein